MFPETAHFSETEFLGEGSLGQAWLAVDEESGAPVVVKVLPPAAPWATYRLQSEFSTLQGLSHRNLVPMLALHDEQEPWFVTMPAIEGSDLTKWRETHPGFPALREVFVQLTHGLMALHSSGLTHRTLSPAAVRITPSGIVRLLDGGLAELLFDPRADPESDEARYQAPELKAGAESITPAVDWFSLGAMIGELLPEPPPPIARLITELADPDPLCRPDGVAVLACLAATPARPRHAPSIRPFVGRDAALMALKSSLEKARTGPSVAILMGQPGAGVTSLARYFVDQHAARRSIVLTIRCRAPDQAPFSVLNALVDALPVVGGGTLSAALARMFPVLEDRLPGVHEAPLPPDPRAVRFLALDDLRRLLVRLTHARTLVVFIDNLQWADAISARVFADLLSADESPRMLLLGGCPLQAADGAFLGGLAELRQAAEPAGWFSRIPVPALSDTMLQEALLLQDLRTAEQRQQILSKARGNPLFAERMLRQGAIGAPTGPRLTLRQLLVRHIAGLPAPQQHILAVLAAASAPLPAELLDSILGEDRSDEIAALADDRLIVAGAVVGLAHDAIQEAVAARTDLTAHHRAVAAALMDAGGDPIPICWHYTAAGAFEEATPFAIQAADRAAATLQLEAAARFYEQALDSLAEGDARRKRVVAACSAVLVRLGRSRRAAPLLDEIATLRDDDSWRRRAAEQWIAAGEHDRGVDMLRELLERAGIRWPTTRTEQGLLMRVGMTRLRLQQLPEGWQVANTEDNIQHQQALAWTTAQALWSVEPARVQYLLMLLLQQALRRSDPRQAARAGLLLYAQRRMPERLATCHALAARLDQPELLALSDWMTAATEHAGHPADSLVHYRSAITRFEQECPESLWESQQARAGLLDALWWCDDRAAIRIAWQDNLSRARRLHSPSLWCAAALCGGRLALLEGRLGRARERAAQILTRVRPGADSAHARLLQIRCALYADELSGLATALTDTWDSITAADLQLRPELHIHALDTRAAAITALIAAHHRGEPPRRAPPVRTLQRTAARILKAMLRSDRADMRALALLHRGSLAAARGEVATALPDLAEARAQLEALHLPLYAALCATAVGQLIGRTDTTLRDLGVGDSAALFRAFLPGLSFQSRPSQA